MEDVITSIGLGTVAWFLAAGVLFFNPVVDRLYRTQESHPAVRALPQTPKTIGMIIAAVFVQTLLWAGVYLLIEPALGEGLWTKAMTFAGILIAIKIIPRDIDRVLLTTYPKLRLWIELVIGCICALVTGLVFAWWL